MSKKFTEDSKTIYSNRHLNYLDVNGLCWHFFNNQNENKIPSSRYMRSFDGTKLREYLVKIGGIELASSKHLEPKSVSPESPNSFGMSSLADMLSNYTDTEQSTSYLFLIDKSFEKFEITSPIIVKIYTESAKIDKEWVFAAASYDSIMLHAFVEKLHNTFATSPDYSKNTFFGILMNVGESIQVKEIPINDEFSKNIDIGLNYGKDFVTHHAQIMKKLTTSNNGLFLFHGFAGTGKTTYIKHLAKIFGGKRSFIFIPTTFIDALTSPNIIPVLLEHPNSVLVLEDAEKAIISREENQGNESLVSSLLNIGDGILGSMLNLTIILTFNTGREHVDKALLRKGRLHYEYEFDKLNVRDSQELINELKFNYKAVEPMSLAEIYNINTETNHKEPVERKVGFN